MLLGLVSFSPDAFSSHTDSLVYITITELVGVMIKSGTTTASFVECLNL
jgi:hypothetical protein